MKMWKGVNYWATGFENSFDVVATKASLSKTIEFCQGLVFVTRTIITNENGKVLYDEKKPDPYKNETKKNKRNCGVAGKKKTRARTRKPKLSS